MNPPNNVSVGVRRHLRPRKSRCKTGCICCRLRKKKCDENRPACITCKRLGLICSYLTTTEFAWRKRTGLSLNNEAAGDNRSQQKPSQESHEETRENTTVSPIIRFSSCSSPNYGLGTPHMTGGASSELMGVYVGQVAPRMLSIPKDFPNPFIQDVLPIAFSDALIMNAVLALGGSTVGVCWPVKEEEERLALQYYGEAIKGLKKGLAGWSAASVRDWEALRLFITVLLLCHYEIIRGNKEGHFFHHLRACRVFAPIVYAMKDIPWRSLTSILLENYVWLELCSSLRLTPDEVDIVVTSRSVIPQLESLREEKTFGVMFGSASQIFQYVPDICELAVRRKKELETCENLRCEEAFCWLKSAITSWRGDDYEYSAVPIFTQGRIAAEIISQNALLLFLMSAYFQERDHGYLLDASQPLVDEMIELLPVLRQTTFANTTFWPVIVTATFARGNMQRKKIIEYFSPLMPVVIRALEVLQWVWESPGGVIGLSGLAKVIKSHNTSYCFG